MRHLFSDAGQAALAAVMAREPLLAFDFDGTLAPIVARPDDARVPQEVSLGLAALARRLPVAVITGRSLADVRGRLGFEPRYIVGNHGAEEADDAPPPEACHALDTLRRRIDVNWDVLRAHGVDVEDKRFSLALHYRLAPDAGEALLCIEELLQGMDPGLRRFGGKCVVNVVPAGLPDKGAALATLVRRAGASAALFVGDDVNDEAVFIRAEPDWLTVKIGREDPLSRAMFFLDSETELAVVLEKMREFVEAQTR
jgi:trehalose 6-phosphate phosphatase